MRYLSKLIRAEEVSVRAPRMIGDPEELPAECDDPLAQQAMDTLIGMAVRQAGEIAQEARLQSIQAFLRCKDEALSVGYGQGLAQSREEGGRKLRGQADAETEWLAGRTAELDAQLGQTLDSVHREALDFAFGLAGRILDEDIDRGAACFTFLTGEAALPGPAEESEEHPCEEAFPEAAAAIAPAGEVNLTVQLGGGSLRVEKPDVSPFPSFGDIAGMDDGELRRLAAACKLKDIMVILRGSEEPAAERIRQALPERIRATVSEELVLMGPVSQEELEDARGRILRVLIRLRRTEKAGVPRPNGGAAVV